MKNLNLKITLIILFMMTNYLSFAQNIDWDRVSVGISISQLKFSGELGTFWEERLEAGLLGQYNLEKGNSLIGGFNLSKIAAKNKVYPDFFLLTFFAGFKYKIDIWSKFGMHGAAGIQSSSLYFYGEASKIVEENDVESEFGLFGQIGVSFDIYKSLELEIYIKKQLLFSEPEELQIMNFGINIFVF